ncbi:MAG TPA: sugar phosphate nucleotidyltransferase [Gammaproteobacteria bacterium]|jgi:NDP-sugar pyrophosphorylase family protein|nr:sugar phosphate nucleotidyltransferase [Gammaproteobacteria bacterium]
MISAVILAGGLATRLRPLTETIPKSLIIINDEPFIDHQLRLLQQQGLRKIVLCVGRLGELIEQHVGNGARYGLQVQYSWDDESAQTRLLGTAGAVKKALPLLGDQFFVLYGDSYLNCDYAAVAAAFHASQQTGLMTVFHNNGQWDSSNIAFQAGKIIAYDKINRTPSMQYIDYGLGVFASAAFDSVPAHTFYDLAMVYQTLLQQRQLAAYEVTQRFYEIGSFTGIQELEYYLAQ